MAQVRPSFSCWTDGQLLYLTFAKSGAVNYGQKSPFWSHLFQSLAICPDATLQT